MPKFDAVFRRVQTSVCDVCDMLMPLRAEGESFHASAAAF
jgi:hypothetical protein